MATFRKRGNKWSYRIDIGRDPVTNERKQVTVSKSKEFPKGFFTKKEAQTAAAKHQAEIDDGTYVKEKDMSFSALIEEWIKDYSNRVKPPTVRIRRHESAHLLSYFEHHKAKNITKKMYQDAINDLKQKGLSDSTIEGIHVTGRMVFSYGVEFDLIKVNPTLSTRLPKTQKTVEEIESGNEVPKYLEKEQLALFLKTAEEKGLFGDYLTFLVLAYSGIRDGELCALKETDFDDNEHVISITKTYYNPVNNIRKYQLGPPKTEKAIRKIEVEPIVFEELKRHMSRVKEIKMANRKTYYDKGFVFVNNENYPGYPIYIKHVENRMRRILKLAGLDTSLTPHSLRHTHTSLCAEAGVGLNEIMDRLGHKDDDTTKNVYLHVTKTMKKEASKKFGNLMKTVNFRSNEV